MNILAAQLLTSGNAIANSSFGQGLKNLIEDAKGFLLVIGVLVCAAAITFLFLKQAAADEHEQVGIKKQIKVVIYCAIGIVAAGSIIALVTSYFQ